MGFEAFGLILSLYGSGGHMDNYLIAGGLTKQDCQTMLDSASVAMVIRGRRYELPATYGYSCAKEN